MVVQQSRLSVIYSLMLAVLAFGIDRAQKHYHVAAECLAIGQARCVEVLTIYTPFSMTGWRGGEWFEVTPFFDYVLIWNTGISYGLLSGLPAWVLGLVMAVAMIGLAIWWVKADSLLIRCGLALCLGGALSNAVDRLIWGAVADFYRFYWGELSFYIFNLADVAITIGMLLLILDALGIGRRKPA